MLEADATVDVVVAGKADYHDCRVGISDGEGIRLVEINLERYDGEDYSSIGRLLVDIDTGAIEVRRT